MNNEDNIKILKKSGKTISVAPMMDWTDRHCRYFHRLISPNALLYTEMVTTGAIIHGDTDRFLRFDEAEHPVDLQLGGSDSKDLATCTKIGADYGYDEINLNCGCPSDRVQSGAFGACLMKTPEHVADCIKAMRDVTDTPVTVKCRIGVDDCDDLPFLTEFVSAISNIGCTEFIIHARKAWLQGLSPKENREKPPLRYDIVEQIKKDHPHLKIHINGGITDIDTAKALLTAFDGIMIGREAYQNPWFLYEMETEIFNNNKTLSCEAVALAMIPYNEDKGKR